MVLSGIYSDRSSCEAVGAAIVRSVVPFVGANMGNYLFCMEKSSLPIQYTSDLENKTQVTQNLATFYIF
jgi:hypothetical protein